MSTENNTQHTPAPWREGTRGPNNCPIIGARGLMIAMLTTGIDFQDEADANASFIVRACNNHDQLIFNLTMLLAYMPDPDVDCDLGRAHTVRKARAILAAASKP